MMKQRGIPFMGKMVLIPSLLASILLAGEQNYIEVGVGYKSEKDNFSTDTKENISTLSKAKSDSSAMPYLSLFYGYDISNNANIYTKFGMDGLQLGSQIDTDYGAFDVGVKGGLAQEEWKNPFQTGVKRETTDSKEYGVYIEYEIPSNTKMQYSVGYEYSSKSFDEDTVVSVLKRDANTHNLAFEIMYPYNGMFFKSGLIYEKHDADGKASSYDEYGLELGVSKKLNLDTKLSLKGEYSIRTYGAYNPVVQKDVDTNTYGVMANLELDKPFDYKNTYVTFKAGYKIEDSNADFYDVEETFGLVSVGYRF